MRSLSSDLRSHLEGAAKTLCWLWKIRCRDETVFGFTNHDVDIEIDGVKYEASSGLTPSEVDRRLGFSIDNGAVQGVLKSQRISPADIKAGLYENAIIETYRANWKDTSQIVHMATGRLGTIRQRGDLFEAEWVGGSVLLNRSAGRVFSKLCDAEFGDARCSLNANNFSEGTTCPRTLSACREQFNNVINFRGFPYLLGDDALQAAPQLSERRDGSSRYK